ncbi:hypothetical protein [Haloarcula sp. 1CSR25-25]|uniref:hypothetical protein n=1 Tax=Haloarcula sp. 1CSR25-25 TaxID=2862545 RepID=UPI002894A629|nr:hypothetical protein [Haloarcula sp. 1CSR25-25]MDT3434260.1 hypothetical protein [Haloarcula sp. 1CSR25-25]
MPCEDCGRLLCASRDDSSLYCPRCAGLPVEGTHVVRAKTEWLLEDYLTDKNILVLVEDYSKANLILASLTQLNQIANVFFSENGMPVSDFGYLAYIIRSIYQKNDFGEEQLSLPFDSDSELEVLKDAYTTVVSAYRDAREQFSICIKNDDFTGEWSNFASDYSLHQSEYGLCFERCVKSILCGDPDHYEDYSYVADVLRSVDKTDVGDVETNWEFGDAWYQFILQLRLMASTDEMVGNIYATRLPSDVTIFDIETFIDALDNRFTSEQHTRMHEEGYATVLDRAEVDQCGELAFGDAWKDVQDQVIVSKNNLDAHPFLFELEVEQSRRISNNRYRREHVPKVFYPRFYTRLLKFQIFPLLKNGEDPSGHEILTGITGDRGEVYERNLYEFLKDNGIECYHNAKLPNRDSREINLLCRVDDSLIFIEVKYLLPPIHLNSEEGVQILNQKFDLKIFNEVSSDSGRSPEGTPFPEIVDSWVDLDAGDRFHSQVQEGSGGREHHTVGDDWVDLGVKKFVVSNVVPSYIEKQGVRFLTDLEFYKLIEHDDDRVLYTLP